MLLNQRNTSLLLGDKSQPGWLGISAGAGYPFCIEQAFSNPEQRRCCLAGVRKGRAGIQGPFLVDQRRSTKGRVCYGEKQKLNLVLTNLTLKHLCPRTSLPGMDSHVTSSFASIPGVCPGESPWWLWLGRVSLRLHSQKSRKLLSWEEWCHQWHPDPPPVVLLLVWCAGWCFSCSLWQFSKLVSPWLPDKKPISCLFTKTSNFLQTDCLGRKEMCLNDSWLTSLVLVRFTNLVIIQWLCHHQFHALGAMIQTWFPWFLATYGW